jgi:phage-related minor tail protein
MSDINKKVQIDVTANGQQAKQEFASTANAAKDMSSTIAKAGGAAADSIDKMGAGAGESAQKVDRASKSMIASIQRATAATQAGGQSTSAYFDAISKQRGLNSDALKPYIDQLRAAEAAQEAARSSLGRTGITAAQTAAALRGVPAQFTDIAVSLSSGQAPMTVLLQQGGQLKDMFGGVGNAAKALGGYVASLVTPFTVAAAAIGGVGYAAYAGSTEMDEFKKNLILTGNISGITTDKFNAMAASMANISGITRGAAAEALTAMAASGNIGADSIERLTRSALQFEKAGGQAVADTVKQFEELGKSPLDASIKLSEKTHYLTLAVYEQIKALQEQGKASEAAALAQKTWADALDQRTPQMVQNLGYIESAWKGVKDAVTGAWDAAKDIGREETAAEKMLRLQRTAGRAIMAMEDPTRYFERDRLKAIKEAADSELKILVDASKKKQDIAKEDAAAAAKNQAQIAAATKYDSLIDSQASKAVKQRKELQLLDADRAAGLVSEEKYQQAKAALAKKYEEKAKPNTQAAREERVYENLLDGLKKQLGVAEKLSAVEKLNIELQEKKYAKLTPMQKANLQTIAAEIDAEKRWQAEGKATVSMIEDAAKAQASARRTLDDAVQSSQRNLETFGMSRSELAEFDLIAINKQIAAERELADEIGVGSTEILRQLQERAAAQNKIFDNERGVENKHTLVNMAKAAEDAHKKAAEKAAAEWEKAADRIDQAFHDAFVKAIEAGSNSFDAFADSIKTSLKAAVADGLYQLTARPLVMNIVGAFAGAQGAAAPGGASGATLGNGFGVASGVQGMWSAYNGGVASAATAFAKSGFGQFAGLSAAPVELAGPTLTGEALTGTALTGAGSTFAAAAGPVLGALAATYAIAEMQKSGWGSDNTGKNYAKDFALFGGTAGVVVLDRLFGHNRNISNDAQGITGTFDSSGFSGQSFQEKSQKGGTFSKDKRWTDYGAIGADMDKALDSMLKQAVSGVQTIGKTLGVESTKAMEGFSHTFALQLSENGDMSKAGEKIAAELKKVQDELTTRLVPNIADFARYGESASDTFARLNNEVQATDAILLAMGKDSSTAFGAVGLASIKAREDLIDLAGGIDSLARKTQTFYSAFYTQDEQLQLAAKQAQTVLASGFSDIGQAIPASREAFRALVESQDLSTESGRKLFNGLLDLSDEFDTVTKASEAAADNLKKSADKLKEATAAAQQGQASLFDTFATDGQKLAAAQKLINDAFAGLGKSVPATAADFLDLTKAIDPATEAGQSLIATLQKVSGAFSYVEKSAADSAAAKEAAAQSASQAAKEAAQAAAQAATQSSGSQRSIMDQFDPAGALARYQADIAAAFAKYGATDLIPTTRAGVSDVAGRIDTSTALGQQQMADLSSLSSAFDAVFGAQENAARAAADAAKAAADQQAKAAQDALDAAQRAAAEQARLAQQAADEQMRLANQVHDSISGALKSLLGQSEQFESQSRQMAQATLQSALVIAKAGGSLSNFQGLDAALNSVTKLDKAAFATASQYAVEFGRTANLLTQLEQYTRINGSHANGLDYVPFDGYVAQLHKGERVQTAASATAADATVEEVKALRSDLNAIGAALAAYTQKTAKLMAKFDVEGIPARV